MSVGLEGSDEVSWFYLKRNLQSNEQEFIVSGRHQRFFDKQHFSIPPFLFPFFSCGNRDQGGAGPYGVLCNTCCMYNQE
jgi:hypothetical protein